MYFCSLLSTLTLPSQSVNKSALSADYTVHEQAAAPANKKGNVIIRDVNIRPLSVELVDSEDHETIANSSTVSVEMLKPTQASRLGLATLSANRFAIGNMDNTGSMVGSMPGSSSLVNSHIASTVSYCILTPTCANVLFVISYLLSFRCKLLSINSDGFVLCH